MHVLILSQYFLPETGATTNRIVSLAKGLQQRGHSVTVVTAKPNHPEGFVPDEYQGGLIRRDEQDGIPTIHTAVYTNPETTFATRILNYTTFMASAVLGAVRPRAASMWCSPLRRRSSSGRPDGSPHASSAPGLYLMSAISGRIWQWL